MVSLLPIVLSLLLRVEFIRYRTVIDGQNAGFFEVTLYPLDA